MRTEVLGSKGYTFDEHGQVFDPNGNPLPVFESTQGLPKVKLTIDRQWKVVGRQVARLILNTIKPVEKSDFKTVVHLDGNPQNVAPSNLDWSDEQYQPPILPGINATLFEFAPIPGYSVYEINAAGEVRYAATKTLVKEYRDAHTQKVGYSLVNDLGNKSTVGMYRLLAAAFLPHPLDYGHLVVNHIDGDPLNCRLYNLEWATYSENIKHAYDNNLREIGRTVLLFNVVTKEETTHQTLAAAAAYIGVSVADLCVYITGRTVSRFTPRKGYIAKYSGDPTPWSGPWVRTTDTRIVARNWRTNELRLYRSVWDAFTGLGISEGGIKSLLEWPYVRPWKGWMLQWEPEGDDKKLSWPNYPADVTEGLEKMARKSKSVVVTCLTTGKKRFFYCMDDWKKTDNLNIDVAVINRAIAVGRNVWFNHEVTVVDPKDLATDYVTLPVPEEMIVIPKKPKKRSF